MKPINTLIGLLALMENEKIVALNEMSNDAYASTSTPAEEEKKVIRHEPDYTMTLKDILAEDNITGDLNDRADRCLDRYELVEKLGGTATTDAVAKISTLAGVGGKAFGDITGEEHRYIGDVYSTAADLETPNSKTQQVYRALCSVHNNAWWVIQDAAYRCARLKNNGEWNESALSNHFTALLESMQVKELTPSQHAALKLLMSPVCETTISSAKANRMFNKSVSGSADLVSLTADSLRIPKTKLTMFLDMYKPTK